MTPCTGCSSAITGQRWVQLVLRNDARPLHAVVSIVVFSSRIVVIWLGQHSVYEVQQAFLHADVALQVSSCHDSGKPVSHVPELRRTVLNLHSLRNFSFG